MTEDQVKVRFRKMFIKRQANTGTSSVDNVSTHPTMVSNDPHMETEEEEEEEEDFNQTKDTNDCPQLSFTIKTDPEESEIFIAECVFNGTDSNLIGKSNNSPNEKRMHPSHAMR